MRATLLTLLTLVATGCDADCPTSADSCPAGCGEIHGIRRTAQCASISEVVACSDDLPDIVTTDIGCVVRLEDQQVFRTTSGTYSSILSRFDAWRK